MVVRSARTNTSTAFSDASGAANSRMGDSFLAKSTATSKAVLAKASDDSTASCVRNKIHGKNSQMFKLGEKLDSSRNIEGSVPKKLIKERNASEKAGDAATASASNDSNAAMLKAKTKLEGASSNEIMYDKSKRRSWGTTGALKTDIKELNKASDESNSGRNMCKSRNVESKVFSDKPAEPVKTGRAHKGSISSDAAPKMPSSRTNEADRKADQAAQDQMDGNRTARGGNFAKNHASHIFSDTPPKVFKVDNRKNTGCSGGIFDDGQPTRKPSVAQSMGKFQDNAIFNSDKVAPEHKACRSAVHDKNAGADVFSNTASQAPKACRASVHDKNAGANVFSDAPTTHKMSRGGVAYHQSDNNVFSDAKPEVRASKSSCGRHNNDSTHNIFHDSSAPAPSKYASNPKNADHGMFSGGAFAQDATASAVASKRLNITAVSRPTSSAGRPTTGSESARDRAAANRAGNGSLW